MGMITTTLSGELECLLNIRDRFTWHAHYQKLILIELDLSAIFYLRLCLSLGNDGKKWFWDVPFVVQSREGLSCSPGAPLQGGAGLGFLDHHPVRICQLREWYLKI
jgi:hypothetical protein